MGNASRPRLTTDQHATIGAELKSMRDRMGNLGQLLSTARGAGKLWREAYAVQRRIDRLRCDLEEVFFADYPDVAVPDVYYPGPDGQPFPVDVAELVRRNDLTSFTDYERTMLRRIWRMPSPEVS